MLDDRQAMDRVQQAIRRYARSAITRGEALDDLVDILESCGRDVTGEDAEVRVAPESRSWATAAATPEAASGDAAPAARDQPNLPF